MGIIKKDELIDAIRILGLVPERAGIPSSDYFRVIPRKKMLEIAISSSVTAVVRIAVSESVEDLDKPFFIDRRILTPFVLAGKDFRSDFQVGTKVQDKWVINQGRRQAELSVRTDGITGYMDWKDHKSLKEIKLTEELRRMLMVSNTCSTEDPSLQHLNCVYLGGKLVLATNQTVIFVGAGGDSTLKFPFPLGVIPLLGESVVQAVGVEGEKVILDCKYGYVEGTVSAIAQQKFPKDAILHQIENAEKWPVVAKLPAEKLSKVLGRLTTYLGGVKKESWVLNLEITDSQIKAVVRVKQVEFKETISVEAVTKETVVVEWPLDAVKPIIDYIAEKQTDFKIKTNEQNKTPYLIDGAGIRMMMSRAK